MTSRTSPPAAARTAQVPSLPTLGGRRRLARCVLLVERLWPALWPATGAAGAFVAAALLGLPGLLPPAGAAVLLVAIAGIVLWLGVRGLRGVTWPDAAAADRRLEHASGLAHRPLAALVDRPAGTDPAHTDPATLALWQAHRARAALAVRRLRVGWPHPGLARRDLRGLRGGLVVALVAAVVIAGDQAPGRLAQALWPATNAGAAPVPRLLAWVTPPAYTGLAPIYLRPDAQSEPIPTGSRLAVSLAGGSGQPALRLDGRAIAFHRIGADGFSAAATLVASGRLAVRRGGRTLGAWPLVVVADRPPSVAWAAPPGPLPVDPVQTRLPWRTSDDYGVVTLQARLRLAGRPDAPLLVVKIPLPAPGGDADAPAGAERAGGTVTRNGDEIVDLTAHPWAGLPVRARLVGRDGAGQSGASATAEFVLPAPDFRNPLARALVTVRQALSLAPDRRAAAAGAIAGLLDRTDAFGVEYGAWLELRLDAQRLLLPAGDGRLNRVQRSLWHVAQRLEDAGLDPSARALAQARRAVRDALDRALHDPSAANRRALEARLRRLERAIDARLNALRRDLARQGIVPPRTAAAAHRLEDMAEAARRAAQQGDMQSAQARIAALQRLLNSLNNAKAMAAQARRELAAQQRAQQELAELNALIRREGRLVDHAHQRLQQAQTAGGPSAQPPGHAPTSDPAAQRAADASAQQALHHQLGQLMHSLEALAGQRPPSLGRARTAMGGASTALGAGKDGPAEAAEQAAIAALQKGGQELGQALAKQFGSGQEGQGRQPGGELGLARPGNGADGGPSWLPGLGGLDEDPFGRREGAGGDAIDPRAQVTLPADAQGGRTRQIEEELRRRQGQRTRPPQELEYIDRLLKQF